MKLLIIAGPYEADLLRRVAVAGGAEAVAIEAGESLPGWIAAARPDAIVLAARVVHELPERAVETIRGVPGGQVPIVLLCDAADEAQAAAAADGAFVRPVVPDVVVRRARDLVRARQGEGSAVRELESPGSSARRRFPSEPGSAPRSGSSPFEMPSLKPLERELSSATRAHEGTTTASAPWLRRIAASIDETFESEMEQTLQSLGGRPRQASTPPDRSERGVAGEPTRQVPRDLVDSILAAVSARPPATVAGPSPLLTMSDRLVMGDGASRAGDAWLEGDLADVDMPTLLGRCLIEGLTGRLRVRREQTEKSVFFEAGRPVLAVSNLTADRMVQMLVRQGRITPEQGGKAVSVATATGRRMGAVLIDLGFMKSSELLPAVRLHYEEIIASLFHWEAGRFHFEVGEVADPRRVRLLRHPAALVLEGVRRAFSGERLRKALGTTRRVFRLDARANGSDVLLELTGLDAAMQRLPVLFDGIRTLDEVVRVSGLPDHTVWQVALTLRAFGQLVAVDDQAGSRVLADVEPVLARDREVDRARIETRFALVRDGDYFQILGLERDAGAEEARAAHERLTRELADDAIGPELAREHATELVEIREVLDEACWVISDERVRTAYRANLSPVASHASATRAAPLDAVAASASGAVT